MNFLDKLNPEQREAVLHRDGPLLILAGAGSGKTRVITYRIAHLIGDGHAEPGQVLAVTFTNKAAQEMRERVEALIGSECEGIWLSTFHALCARLLRREAPKIGLSRDFVIYDSSDQVAVVRQAQRDLGIDDKLVPPRVALGRISQAKNRMEGPESMRGTWNLRDEQIAKIYERYLQALRDSNALDFDDLLLRTVELFETSETTRDFYARKFRYVMVDEYQDTNRPQYLLISRLAAHHRNLAVVGDPDQSIYKWRGADLRNIMDFEHDFPEARIVKLEQNYRSTQVILDAASAVISQNRNRKDKRLWTDRRGGTRIVYYRGNDEIEEADFIMRSIKDARAADVDSTVEVLYRTNSQSRAFEESFRRAGIPYRLIGLSMGGILVPAIWCVLQPASDAETALRRCIWPIGIVTLFSQDLFAWYMLWLLPLTAIFLKPSNMKWKMLTLPKMDAWMGWWLFCGLVGLSYTFFIKWKPVSFAIQVEFIPLYLILVINLVTLLWKKFSIGLEPASIRQSQN
jgi:DNA helicase-2/ATP-dependent DNA helicase PcrA